jgi:hypothetical protein
MVGYVVCVSRQLTGHFECGCGTPPDTAIAENYHCVGAGVGIGKSVALHRRDRVVANAVTQKRQFATVTLFGSGVAADINF